MKQISYEQRLEAVLNVTEKHMSQQEAADLLGTARAQVHLLQKSGLGLLGWSAL